MKYGLSESTIGKIQHVLAQFPAVEKAIVYGSRAKGNFKPGSDIDLTLCGTALTSAMCSNVAEALDDLLLPYTIDLSVFERLNHASLREHIERVGVVFYERANNTRSTHWQSKPFEDCIERTIYTEKIQRKDFLSEGVYPVVSQEDGLINGYWNNEADLFKTEQPLIVFGDHTRVLKYVDFDFVLGADGVKILQPKPFLLPRFLYYQLQTANLESLGYARHYRLLKDLEIKFPPLPEQQRIVGILDEAFEGIATAKANTEKNLHNARALFESHLEAVFTQCGEGWQDKRLDTVAEFSQGIQVGLADQSNTPSDVLVRFIRIIDYTQGTEDIRYVKDPGRRYWADKSDIVMVRYGTPGLIGRGIEGVIANNLFKITILDNSMTKDFLAYFLSQLEIQNYLSSQGSSTMPALTFKQLGEVIVSFPRDLGAQNSIASKLDGLREETQRLASIYERKLAALDALKKSLLHQAFSGQLTGSAP